MLCSLVRLCCRGGVGTCHMGKAGDLLPGRGHVTGPRGCALCRPAATARPVMDSCASSPLLFLFLSSRRWEGKDENEVGRCLETGCVHVRVDHKYYRPTEVVSATPPAKLIWCGGGGVMSLVTRLICTLGTPRPAPPHRRLMVLP